MCYGVYFSIVLFRICDITSWQEFFGLCLSARYSFPPQDSHEILCGKFFIVCVDFIKGPNPLSLSLESKTLTLNPTTFGETFNDDCLADNKNLPNRSYCFSIRQILKMANNLETHLQTQLKSLNAVGQVSTLNGDEVLCTVQNRDSKVQAATLATAFIEIDNLSKSLKLGDVRQVILSGAQCGDSVVQTKLWAKTEGPEEDALLTTTVAPKLQNALVGDSILNEATSRVLNG